MSTTDFEDRIKKASQDQAARAETRRRADEDLATQRAEFLIAFYQLARNVISEVLERAKQQIERPGKVKTVIRHSDDRGSIEFAVKLNGGEETLTFYADPLEMLVHIRWSSTETGTQTVDTFNQESVEAMVAAFIDWAFQRA